LTHVNDKQINQDFFRCIDSHTCIRKTELTYGADWILTWCDPLQATFGERLIAFAAVEGTFFSGFSAAFFWLNIRGLMPGLCF
jgi:hypothetical protein